MRVRLRDGQTGAGAEVSENQDGGYFHLSASLPDPWEREGLVASIADNDVALAVAESGDDADAFAALAEQFFKNQETSSEDVLKRYSNVVVEWSETPTDEETDEFNQPGRCRRKVSGAAPWHIARRGLRESRPSTLPRAA
jgi:hypothetical protein